MTHHGHSVKKCKHGVVVLQCRCPGLDKPHYIVDCPPECSGPVATVQIAKVFGASSTLDSGHVFTISWVEPLSEDDARHVVAVAELALRRLKNGEFAKLIEPGGEGE